MEKVKVTSIRVFHQLFFTKKCYWSYIRNIVYVSKTLVIYTPTHVYLFKTIVIYKSTHVCVLKSYCWSKSTIVISKKSKSYIDQLDLPAFFPKSAIFQNHCLCVYYTLTIYKPTNVVFETPLLYISTHVDVCEIIIIMKK